MECIFFSENNYSGNLTIGEIFHGTDFNALVVADTKSERINKSTLVW